MNLPYFYNNTLDAFSQEIVMEEAASKHMVQVLRMQNGERLQLTNGKGDLFTAEITDNNRKKCVVKVVEKIKIQNSAFNISIAISPVKNNARFEWFLEKATEIGVTEIIPLVCTRTEKTVFKPDRMNSILVSAMLQSRQSWLPVLQAPVKFSSLAASSAHQKKLIAHCEEGKMKKDISSLQPFNTSTVILIGPEGDFTPDEIELALENQFIPVSLGNTRLRTETAGVVAAAILVNLL